MTADSLAGNADLAILASADLRWVDKQDGINEKTVSLGRNRFVPKTRNAMRALLMSLVLLMLIAPSASAVTCRNWERLDDYQKTDTVDRLITHLQGSGGREFSSVDRGAVARCPQASSQNIQYDIDDECTSGGGMNAPRGILKDYIWSCVR